MGSRPTAGVLAECALAHSGALLHDHAAHEDAGERVEEREPADGSEQARERDDAERGDRDGECQPAPEDEARAAHDEAAPRDEQPVLRHPVPRPALPAPADEARDEAWRHDGEEQPEGDERAPPLPHRCH